MYNFYKSFLSLIAAAFKCVITTGGERFIEESAYFVVNTQRSRTF